MSQLPARLTIGQVAERSGLPRSTLRFYEERGIIHSERNSGNQRRYPRHILRRLAFITAAQRIGLTLTQIRAALDTLPDGRTPRVEDWRRLSTRWHAELEARIDALQRLRDNLTDCIGCGCLSLKTCTMMNADDELSAYGPGAPFLKPVQDGGLSTEEPAEPEE
ncbi:redox-sensitive transcriptional activator SoxR [Lipingzhangella sp. LS1_29]|uniref:Redox-sensitive transcriptional activator SoxR n=1 Tax=Lipingzhangella rawalii TaxID=2055835 RepID=A0ABU2H4Y6_9ACTN|nr:redox-sensitive transcriptional activator SoxR [Lipingzhangella rawalii]MDS1270374.1 redox-sensitive transcriptional activator SoxR [Lipingzhangella rawalii]